MQATALLAILLASTGAFALPHSNLHAVGRMRAASSDGGACTFGAWRCSDTQTLTQCGYVEGNALAWRLHSTCPSSERCVDDGPNGFVGCDIASYSAPQEPQESMLEDIVHNVKPVYSSTPYKGADAGIIATSAASLLTGVTTLDTKAFCDVLVADSHDYNIPTSGIDSVYSYYLPFDKKTVTPPEYKAAAHQLLSKFFKKNNKQPETNQAQTKPFEIIYHAFGSEGFFETTSLKSSSGLYIETNQRNSSFLELVVIQPKEYGNIFFSYYFPSEDEFQIGVGVKSDYGENKYLGNVIFGIKRKSLYRRQNFVFPFSFGASFAQNLALLYSSPPPAVNTNPSSPSSGNLKNRKN
ncbi:hypothetical protein BJ741DRAFT_591052, partial [Chytriomyces cf. hyalinus JEL632]